MSRLRSALASSQSQIDGLYNYPVFYFNTVYISLYSVDIYFFVGGGMFSAVLFLESSHRVCLIELLLYDNFCATRIKYIVHNVQDYRNIFIFFFIKISVLPVYVRVGILLTS